MFTKKMIFIVAVLCLAILLLSSVSMAWTEEEKELAINAGKRLSSIAESRGGGTAAIDRWERRILERIFDDVAREASRYVHLPYTLHIMNSRQADGWSYSDGSVYITRGLLNQLEYYDEIAGIFGYLLGHVVLKHNIEAMLQTSEGRELLESIGKGEVAPTQENLGKYRLFFLAIRYLVEQVKEAGGVGVSMAYRAGYRQWGLDLALSKIAAFDKNAPFFNAHPHPDVKPYSPAVPPDDRPYYEPERPRIIDEKPEEVDEPKEENDVAEPAPSIDMSIELFIEAGQYPYFLTPHSTILEYEDDDDTYLLQLDQRDIEGSQNIGAGLAIGLAEHFFGYTKIGFGLQGGSFEQSKGGTPFVFELGGGLELGSDSASFKAGVYWGVLSQSSEVGTVQPADESDFGFMDVEKDGWPRIVMHGTPINARTSASGLGGFATLDLSVSKDGPANVFVTIRYQSLSASDYSFTARCQAGDTVTIPFEGEYPQPFDSSGLAISGGIKLKW